MFFTFYFFIRIKGFICGIVGGSVTGVILSEMRTISICLTSAIASQPESSGSWMTRQKEALDLYKELSESTPNEELDEQAEAYKEPTCTVAIVVEEQGQNGEKTSTPSSNPKGKGNIKRGRRTLAELEEENLVLDNERLREETKRIKLEQENLKLAKEVFILKKQCLICKLQSEFPDCVQILNEP